MTKNGEPQTVLLTPEATKVYARLIVAPVRNAMEETTARGRLNFASLEQK